MGNAKSGVGGEVESVLQELRTLEQRVSSIHAVQRQEVAALTVERLADAGSKNGGHAKDRVTIFGAHAKAGEARILVGPIIGKVTESTVRVMLEVDRDQEIKCHLCLFNSECPGGRELTSLKKMFKKRKPGVFQFEGLPANVKFHVAFSGVERSDLTKRTGSFRTLRSGQHVKIAGVYGHSPAHMNPELDNQDGVWQAINRKLEQDELDLILHVGGQVDLRHKFHRCAAMLNQSKRGVSASGKQPSQAEAEMAKQTENLVLEILRDGYRSTWNEKHVRNALANCSNLMIWSDLEISVLPSRNSAVRTEFEEYMVRSKVLGTENSAKYPPMLLVLAQRAYREYQRLLWDDGVDEVVWGADGTGNCEHFFLRPHQNLGILALDTRTAHFNPDGTSTPWPTSKLISNHQMTFIRNTLAENMDLQSLIVLCDRPLLRCGYELPYSDAKYDAISENEMEQAMLFNLFYSWKSSTEIIYLCGTGPYDFGAETVLRGHGHSRKKILQACIPPLSDCYQVQQQLLQRGVALGLTSQQGSIKPVQVLKDDMEDYFAANLVEKVDFIHTFINKPPILGRMLAEVVTTDGNSGPSVVKLIETFNSINDNVNDKVQLTLGPIIGNVSQDSAILVVQVDGNCTLTCELVDDLSGKKISMKRRFVKAHKVVQFCFEQSLRPDRTYKVKISPGMEHVAVNMLPSFHTMPDVAHIKENVEHRVTLFAVSGNSVTHEPLSQESSPSLSLWNSIDEMRQIFEPYSPTATIHLGLQVDLEMVRDDLQQIVRSHSEGRRPEELTSSELSDLKQRLFQVVKQGYETTWMLPDVFQVLSHGCNVMLISKDDVREPATFQSLPDLIPWCETIRRVALDVALAYQDLLNRNTMQTKSSLSSSSSVWVNPMMHSRACFKGLCMLGGGVGILLFSCASVSSKTAKSMLSPFDWIEVDKAVQTRAQELKSLIFASDIPILTDSPMDAESKKTHIAANRYSLDSWASYPDECIRLLDIAFAWKAEEPGRDVLLLAHDLQYSFTTSIVHATAEPKMSIAQVCVGPITRALNEELNQLPFRLEGTVDAIEVTSTGIREPKFHFHHKESHSGYNSFAVLNIGTHRRDGFCSIERTWFTRGDQVSKKLPVNSNAPISTWMLGALQVGERAKANRSRQSNQLWAQERKAMEETETQIKQAYPNMKLPEALEDPPPVPPGASLEDPTSEHNNADDEDSMVQMVSEANSSDKTRQNQPIVFGELNRLLKWIDIDIAIYGPSVAGDLYKWIDFIAENSSPYAEGVEASYANFAEESSGVPIDKLPDMICDFFARTSLEPVLALCFPKDCTFPSKTFICRSAINAVLKRRTETAAEDTLNMHSFPFAEVLPICNCVGTLCVLSKQIAEK